MIQRIQSIYLLIAFGLMTALLFLPIATLTDASANLFSFQALGIKDAAGKISRLDATIPFAVITAISAIINLIAIFMYKKRLLQKRLGIFNIILMIGIYAVIYIIPNYLLDIPDITVNYQYAVTFPGVSAIFVFMANKAIQKDINIIKSYDRIR